ncbi:NAD-dependent epimerase/dehydratase family protein [Saccharopolyspora mangrovi]|uniref:NAD(P)-dependent oxidoreductase n=1 Tax=Saccharopolyspora mangrovi TaxID=3082379 RepID=A0ABU6AIY5_9PSEU|nr:NAD(P)-dependent oxidoreductase [Saccharopolyspora sp. S2-29]MEB3371524.1 NAD(P)-dependent oxidoreductase [Saccharopolyspora sp. S2-29]
MPLRVVVAGATGVVGKTLLPLLRERGHHVTALARRVDRLEGPTVDEVVAADLLDPDALRIQLRRAAPDVVIDETSAFSAADPQEALRRTAKLRERGTKNLLDAAVSAGARRFIAQGMTAAYRPHGHDVLDEDSPLWIDAPGSWGEMVRALASAEEELFTRSGIEGVSLRYGALYGPDTQYAPGGDVHARVVGSELPLVGDGVGLTSFTHVEDAAGVILEVLEGGDPGAFNVVDNEPAEASEWLPAYARLADAPAPVTLTTEQAKSQLDWLTVHQLTEQRGATNFRLRETLGWKPTWPSWREGFASMFGLWPS